MITFDKKAFRGSIFLFFAALFWGSAFVAQKLCEKYPFATNCFRFLFGSLIMLLILAVVDTVKIKRGYDKEKMKAEKKNSLTGGIVCGITLAFATTLQQLGLSYGTSAGKSGFLTALYMVIIPIMTVFLGKKVGLNVWLAVLLAVVGAFLMSFTEDFSISLGDVLTIACAFCFAVNVLAVDKYVIGTDPLTFALSQMLTSGIICILPLIIVNVTGVEVITITELGKIILPILYIAFFSCCVAYTCQVLGQRDTPPEVGSVIMSLESVFALIFSLTLGGVLGKAFGVDISETLNARIIIGICLVFIGVMLAQFNPFKKRNKVEKEKGKE